MAHITKFIAVLTVTVPLMGASSTLANDDLIKYGKELAKDHCTRCHIVSDINPRGGISSTPSFQLMVNFLKDWEERFETFHVRRPHPAVIRFEGVDYSEDAPPTTVPITLEIDDIEALTEFARTLKKAEN